MKSSVISALGFVAAASAAYPAYNASTTASTTSTVYTTSIYTITSCAPTVTDCEYFLSQEMRWN